MRERNRLQSIVTVVLMSLAGKHTRRKDVLMLEGRALTITSPEPRVFIGDGEVLADARTLELSVVPSALRVITGRLLSDDAYLEVRIKKGAVAREQLGAAFR
jgi:diacylglycerol kinase family enzyme